MGYPAISLPWRVFWYSGIGRVELYDMVVYIHEVHDLRRCACVPWQWHCKLPGLRHWDGSQCDERFLLACIRACVGIWYLLLSTMYLGS